MTSHGAAREIFQPKGDPVSLRLLEQIEKARRVLLLTHHNPDGDALGTAAAFQKAFQAKGLYAALHLSGHYTDNLAFLLKGTPLSDLSDLESYDLALLLDCHGLDRLGPESQRRLEEYFRRPESAPLAVIDHHLLEEGEKAGPLWHHDIGASSTGELALEVISAAGLPLEKDAAEALLVAIVTDTGSFSQTNATSQSLMASAFLLEQGASLAEVDFKLNRGRPVRRYHLLAEVLSTLELHHGGRVATCLIGREMLEKSRASLADSDGFVEIMRTISGVELGALIKITEGPYFKVSLRSQGDVDAAALAAFFGGGGHRQAASYSDREAKSLEETKARFLKAAPQVLS